MKRSNLLILLALPAVLTLAACGSDDDEPAADVAEVAEPADEIAAEPVAEEPAEEPAPAAEEAPAADEPADDAAEDESAAGGPGAVGDVGAAAPVERLADGTIVGVATAREAAVIEMGDATRVMLYGLETVYPPQDNGDCRIEGRPWGCWAAAVRTLQTMLAEAGALSCVPQAPPDAYRRELAICTMADGRVLNEEYIRSGFAIAIEDEMPEYAAIEEEARAARVGLWQGTFVEPAAFRASRAILQRRP
ncbi:MAG: thermonuclease family protein [Bauldia sp.]|nr:thermonuclease family protein [Bauldia sp.]